MTQQEAKVMWPIIKAWGEGGTIQVNGEDLTSVIDLVFDRPAHEYTIKPPPLQGWVALTHRDSHCSASPIYPTREDVVKDYPWAARFVQVREVAP